MSLFIRRENINQIQTMSRLSLQRLKIWNAYKSEYKTLLRIGLPVLITELGIIVVSFADTMMVGMYGTKELAAAAFVNNLFMIAIVMMIGFSSGITPIVGAYYSRKCNRDVGQTLRVGAQLNASLGMLFTVIMGTLYFFLDRMGQPEELLPLIRSYYLIMLISLLPMSLFNCFQQVANGTTDTAMPMWITLSVNIINIVGNYILIFGHFGMPELGLVGAGLSTLFARIVGAIAIIAIMLTSSRYRPYRDGALQHAKLGRERMHLLKTSMPVMLQSGIETVMWSFGAVVCGWFGTLQLAGYQVMVTISQLGFMTYISIGIATSIRVANYMGLKDYVGIRRISSAGLHINMLLCFIACMIFIIWGEPLLHLFTEDSAVIDVAMLLIAPLVLYQIVDAIQITYANALRGTSHVAPLLWVSLISYVLIGVPLLLWLAIGLDMQSVGVYYSFSGALTAAALLLYLSFRHAVRRAESAAGIE